MKRPLLLNLATFLVVCFILGIGACLGSAGDAFAAFVSDRPPRLFDALSLFFCAYAAILLCLSAWRGPSKPKGGPDAPH